MVLASAATVRNGVEESRSRDGRGERRAPSSAPSATPSGLFGPEQGWHCHSIATWPVRVHRAQGGCTQQGMAVVCALSTCACANHLRRAGRAGLAASGVGASVGRVTAPHSAASWAWQASCWASHLGCLQSCPRTLAVPELQARTHCPLPDASSEGPALEHQLQPDITR